MSGAKAPGASVLGLVARYSVEEPYKLIKGIAASSQKLEYINDLLREDLQILLAIKADKESQVQRHKHEDTSMVYRSWKNEVSNIVAEANKLRSKYEEERLPKWRLFQRSSLSEKMAKNHSQVKCLIEEGLSINILIEYKHPETILEALDAPNTMEYPTLEQDIKHIESKPFPSYGKSGGSDKEKREHISSSTSAIPRGRIEVSSKARGKDELASEIKESKRQQCRGLREILNHEFLRLLRIRDFLSLILTYPMKMPNQPLLRKWIDDAQAQTAKYSEHTDFVGVRAYRWMHLLSEKPLRYLEGLIPNDILSTIEDGERFIFNEHAVTLSEDLVASASMSKGKKILELTNVHHVIPEAILNLAADLAVHQLIQTLLASNVHHVRFFTRDGIEKIAVVRKIEASFNDGNGITKKYSRVLWVDVSKYRSNTEVMVRQEIAQKLNLMTTRGDQIDEDHDILLTKRIEEEMMSMKHLVLLVDVDGDKKIDPRKVGFPTKTMASVLVLITTESSQENEELTMAMDLEIRTEDHMLPWELFCRNVGSQLICSSSDIQRIAMQIVKECGGHLLAIVLVARSLKNMEDVVFWERTLERLCYTEPYYDIRDFHDVSQVMVKVFQNIIWTSMNETEKLCLACSLYVLRNKDKMADRHLMSSWVYNKLVHSHEEADHVLRELVDRSILFQLDGRQRHIRWPEEIYDVLKLLLKLGLNPSDVRHGGLGLTETLITEERLDARLVELTDNKLSKLPPSPTCPKVEELLLRGNADLMEIPPLFFALVPKLLVLDLSYTSIRSLPSSFFDLKELKRLFLKGCRRFMELSPEIGRLKNLETLDLRDTPIIYLPERIQDLSKLRHLVLSFHPYQQKIDQDTKSMQYPIMVPAGVISKLTRLISLSIDVNPDDKRWDENVQEILPEIFGLRLLITLEIYIPHVEVLLKHGVPRNNWDFRYIIGRHMHRIISRAPPGIEAKFKGRLHSLKIVNCVNIRDINKVGLRNDSLFLERHGTIKHLSEFEEGMLSRLLMCIVGECNEMQTLVDEKCSDYMDPLSNLEFLCIFYMSNLRSICQGKAYFGCLKIMALHACPNLTAILTSNFLDSLELLEEVMVEDCPKVSTLISHKLSEQARKRTFLPRLRKVSFLYLPELVSISSGLRIAPSLERIGFYDCPKLQSLSTMELGSRNLELIKAEKEWWEDLKWEEAEWGEGGRPNYLHVIFCPVNEEADIMDQLVEHKNENESSRSDKKAYWRDALVGTRPNYLDDIFPPIYEEAEIMDQLVGHENESSTSNKKPYWVKNIERSMTQFRSEWYSIKVENTEQPISQLSSESPLTKVEKTTQSVSVILSKSSVIKRRSVFKVDLHDDKTKSKAMKVVAGLKGVESVSIEGKNLAVMGDIDAVDVLRKLRKLCFAEIIAGGPAKS